jgi:hypothetical protein
MYISCGLFQCGQCSYHTELYSSVEFLLEEENSYCTLCNLSGQTTWDSILIDRTDICEEVILHPQCASIEGCKSCKGDSQKHWTEISARCPHCRVDSMQFSHFTPGKHITTFKEYCLERSKPQHASAVFTDNKGTEWIFLSGPYSMWSAT